MRKHFVLICLFAFGLVQQVYTQTCPPNIDFEAGDFSNWDCFTGKVIEVGNKNVMQLNPSPPTAGRHEIISSSTLKDPYGGFPQLCPYGGKYSVKLGNNNINSEAEGLSYTFTVPTTVDTFTFTYFYAVVFENPGHLPYEQPRFFVSAYDVATGAVINCASYDYVSSGVIPGFKTAISSPGVLYKDWTPASLQFAGLGGRAVRLEFKTADCTLGGHFGYAYVDVSSGCSNILATAPYCKETNSLILNAPYGFKTYTWYTSDYSAIIGNQQSITLSPPPATSGIFHVDVIPYPGYGCRDTLQAIATALPVPDTPIAKSDYVFCQSQPASILTATPVVGNDLLWYTTATGGTGSTNAITPLTTIAGFSNYYVSQKVLFGCESFRKKITVKVTPTPLSSFTVNALRQCQNGNIFTLTSTTTNKLNPTYVWNYGDGQTLSSTTDSIINHTYSANGTFTIKLRVLNDTTCFTDKTISVVVVPKPTAAFTYPPIICEKQTTVNLIDQSTVSGNVAIINKWWWNINGSISQLKNPLGFIPVNGGTMPVQLVATTVEGCSSDTNNIVLDVHYRPTAAYKYSTPLCDNEIINFTDLSTLPLPALATEQLVKWSWDFNSITASVQNPFLNLPPTTYNGKLVTETNFGCKSLVTDSLFTVHSKPNIRLDISDSCVFTSIKYNGIDLLNTVDKWYWDFGTGFYNSNAQISKIFYKTGYNPLTLIGQTIYKCKDTIIHKLSIYDNVAFAGKDTIAAKGEPVQLNANGYPGQQYFWTPALGLDNANIENPVATLDVEQLYKLHSVTKEGCKSDSKILIKRYTGPELYIPTAFTPNSDGLNDVLKVFPVGIKTFNYFMIYNRYGEMVYKTTDYSQGWDGTSKGKLADAGTYVVVAQAVDYRGNLIIKKGTVTLIR